MAPIPSEPASLIDLMECIQKGAGGRGEEDIGCAVAGLGIPEVVPIKRDPNRPVERGVSVMTERCRSRHIEASKQISVCSDSYNRQHRNQREHNRAQ